MLNIMDIPPITGANSTKDAESRLKRFLHYGSELSLYIPCGNLRHKLEPNAAQSVEELLRDDECATKLVPTIEKVSQQKTSIAPCAILYALAMVIRKARQNMEKKPADEGSEVGEESEEDEKSEADEEEKGDEESKPDAEKAVPASECDKPSSGPSEEARKPQKWDLVIRDAYKLVRKLCENQAENLFLFTHFLREIAMGDGKKGFGQGWRQTMRKWYNYQTALGLAQSATKIYTCVHWTHKDILKLLRWKYHEEDKSKDAVFLYILYNFERVKNKYENSTDRTVKRVIKHLKLIDNLRHANDEQALECVKNETITLDYVPPFLLKNAALWLLLIPRMTHEEVLNVICRLSRLKLLKNPDVVTQLVKKLEELNEPKPSTSDSTPTLINPYHVFITRKRYEEGPNLAVEFQYLQRRNQAQNEDRPNRAARGNEQSGDAHIPRQPPPRRNQRIVNCLNTVFNNSISSFAATGKKFLIAIDAIAANASNRCLFERFVSMEEATLLIALGVIRAEPAQNVKLVTFVSGAEVVRDVSIAVSTEGQVTKTTDTMDSLKSKIQKEGCMRGDIGGLIKWAATSETKYDVFIVLGDNTLSVNDPYAELQKYREDVHADAKLVTCCLIGRHKKHLELSKPNMLLICGFDKNIGHLIQAYSRDSF